MVADKLFLRTGCIAGLIAFITLEGPAKLPNITASQLKEINPGDQSSFPTDMATIGNKIIFSALGEEPFGREVHLFEPGTDTIVRLTDFSTSRFGDALGKQFTPFKDGAIFTARGPSGQEIYFTDFTAEGTTIVKDIQAPLEFVNPQILGVTKDPMTDENIFYFTADDGINGREVWVSDGTTSGTTMVTAINNSGDAVEPNTPTGMSNTTIYFAANDGTTGTELWYIVHGGISPTPVVDLLQGPGSSFPRDITGRQSTKEFGEVFFTALDSDGRRQLFITDGKFNGTLQLTTFDGDMMSLDPAVSKLKIFMDDLYFIAFGNSLYKFDTGSMMTELVKVLPINMNATTNPVVCELECDDSLLYISFFPGADGEELWLSDGTEQGTRVVIADSNGSTNIRDLCPNPSGTGITYVAQDPTWGFELHASDGTEQGTGILGDLIPGENRNFQPGELVEFDGKIYLRSYDGDGGYELWSTDGTAQGTEQEANINLVPAGSNPNDLTLYQSGIIFSADSGDTGRELCWTDGSAANTRMIIDLVPGVEGSDPGLFTEMNGNIYFSAFTPDLGRELWMTDGTPEGTVNLRDFNDGEGSGIGDYMVSWNGLIALISNTAEFGAEITLVDPDDQNNDMNFDIKPGAFGSFPIDLTVWNDDLYTLALDPVEGDRQLFRIDSKFNLEQITDEDFQFSGSGFNSLTAAAFGGPLVMTQGAFTGALNIPWVSDGTTEGTSTLEARTSMSLLNVVALAYREALLILSHDEGISAVDTDLYIQQDISDLSTDQRIAFNLVALATSVVLFEQIIDSTGVTKIKQINPDNTVSDVPVFQVGSTLLPPERKPLTNEIEKGVIMTNEQYLEDFAIVLGEILTKDCKKTAEKGIINQSDLFSFLMVYDPMTSESVQLALPGPGRGEISRTEPINEELLMFSVSDPATGTEPWILQSTFATNPIDVQDSWRIE